MANLQTDPNPREGQQVRNRRKYISLAVLISAFFLGLVVTGSPVSATADTASIIKKWSFTGMYQCLRSGYVASSIDMVSKKATLPSGTVDVKEGDKVTSTIFPKSGTIGLPSYNFAGNGGTMNCQEIIATGKYGSNVPATLSYYHSSDVSRQWKNSGTANFLENVMLYAQTVDETGGSFTIDAVKWTCTERGYYDDSCRDGTLKTKQQWSKKDIGTVRVYRTLGADGIAYYNHEDWLGNFFSDIHISYPEDPDEPGTNLIQFKGTDWVSGYTCKSQNHCQAQYKLPYSIQDLADAIRNDPSLSLATWSLENIKDHGNSQSVDYVKIEFNPSTVITETSVTKYDFQSDKIPGIIKAVSSNTYPAASSFRFTKAERFNLYSYYVEQAALKSGSATAIQCGQTHIDGLVEVKLLDTTDGSFKTCDVNFNGVDPRTMEVYTQGFDSESHLIIEKITMQDVIDWLNSLNTDSLSPDELYGVDGKVDLNTGTSGENSAITDACLTGGAAESLGWIICPILGIVSDAARTLYDDIVEPFLNVEPGLVSDNGTLKGWQIFQNFANIAAAILIIVIIFSQVTGVGIDNYGIKKILPKFIIAMVLINLSFIICQLAVDASNIAGKGLKDMFDGLGTTIITDISADPNTGQLTVTQGASSTGAAATVATVGVVGLIITALVALPGVAAMALPGILLSLLGAVLTALIAILTLFVLLTVRKVAVIVLVVVSPLAFACYMLPNTKKLFDKWLSLLKAMLLMFPLCGLVIGGGNFVSKLILVSTGNHPSFALALAALLAGIIPFFFVVTLLKGSMNILGGLGSKLGGLGKSLSGRAKGAVAGSDRFKDFQKQSTMARNKAIYDRLAAKEKAGGTLSAYQRRRMNNARTAYNAAAREDVAATYGGAMLTPGSTALKAAEAAQESATNKQELDNQIIAMAKETDNYDADKMYDQLSGLLGSDHELGHEDEVKMKALMQQLTTKGGYGKKLLAKAAGNATTATRAQAAKFMSKNGDVAAAMNKNMAVAQYLRDVNAGTTKETSFQDWFTKGTHKLGDGRHVSNSSFVLSSVITDDKDFVSQSAGAVETMVNTKESNGEWSLSSDRLSAMVNNERLLDSADSDVRNAIIAAAKARNLSIPVRYGGTPAPAPEAPAAPAPVQAPKPADTAHTVSVSQGAPDAATDSGTINLHEETPKRSSITIATEADLNRTLADIQQRARQGENIIQAADRINHERGQNNGQPPATQ